MNLSQYFDEGTRRLTFLLCLPLIDGVFATLLVTGAVDTFSSAIAISLTVFTGAGALAVLYSHAESVPEARAMVFRAAPLLLLGMFLVALVAPVFEQLFYLQRLQYVSGLVLLAIAAQLADLRGSSYLSVPAIMVTGLLLSVHNPGALALSLDYMMPAFLTGAVAVGSLFMATFIAGRDISLAYIRRGGAAVLFILALSQFGVSLPAELGLAVFAGSLAASARYE